MNQENMYKWRICIVSSLCIATLIFLVGFTPYNPSIYLFFLIQFLVLYTYLMLTILFQGALGKYYKFKKQLASKKMDCIFCNGELNAMEFFMMNKERNIEEIAKIWNDIENKFYCPDCYLEYDFDFHLKTPYNGHYLTDLFITEKK